MKRRRGRPKRDTFDDKIELTIAFKVASLCASGWKLADATEEASRCARLLARRWDAAAFPALSELDDFTPELRLALQQFYRRVSKSRAEKAYRRYFGRSGAYPHFVDAYAHFVASPNKVRRRVRARNVTTH